MEDNKSCKVYFLLEDHSKVYFSGEFDGGNLEKVEQVNNSVYKIYPGYDKPRSSTRKTFFNFRVQGFKDCTVSFVVCRMSMLENSVQFLENSREYHPVYRTSETQKWAKISTATKVYMNSMGEAEIAFTFPFTDESCADFAFSYPYSYEDCEALLTEMKSKYADHPEIYLHDEILCNTSETRTIHLLTITERVNCLKETDTSIQGFSSNRPLKIDKPKVILSARVHPGEAPASYSIEGAIRFLLDQTDYRSYLLRKNFHFLIIPMLNPEGVYAGMFRTDLNGDNLNRMYAACLPDKHVGIWSVKQRLKELKNVAFMFDFHAHPSRKGFFIYGNAFDQFTRQVEAQIFSKMIECNCPYFQHLDCIYSERAMNTKDKNDSYSKEGCARVYYHRQFNIIHAYTVECGYFAPTKLNPVFEVKETPAMSFYGYKDTWEKVSLREYCPQSYMLMGKSILITILDLFHLNPYPRSTLGEYKSVNNLRKSTAQRIYGEVDRFRLVDSNCYRKIKQIALIASEEYYKPRFGKYNLSISENFGMNGRKKTHSINARVYNPIPKQETLKNIQFVKQQQLVLCEEDKVETEQGGKMNKIASTQSQQVFKLQDIPKPQQSLKPGEVFKPKKKNRQEILSLEGHSTHQQIFHTFQKYDNINVDANKSYRIKRIQSNEKLTKLFDPDFKNNFTSSTSLQFKSSMTQNMYQHSLQAPVIKPAKILEIESELIRNLLNTKYSKDFMSTKRTSQTLLKIQRMGSFLKKEAHKERLTHLPRITQSDKALIEFDVRKIPSDLYPNIN